MNILLVGGISENSATAQLIRNTKERIDQIFCWPGSLMSDLESRDIGLPADAPVSQVVSAAIQLRIDLVVLTSESAIQSGIANALQSSRIPCFGPTRVAAHFRWDARHTENVLRAVGMHHGAHPLSTDSAATEPGVRGMYIAMVAGGTVQGVAISSSLESRTTTYLAERFVREISLEDSPYSGWLVMDIVQSEKGLDVTGVRCIPPTEYICNLSVKNDFDFLKRVRKLLKPDYRDINHVVQQTLAPCLVPA